MPLANKIPLCYLNLNEKCQGIITRRRETNGKLEESIIDYIVVCDKILPFLSSMIIDESKVNTLTNFTTKKKGRKAKQSDHNPMIAKFKLKKKVAREERNSVYTFLLKIKSHTCS